MTKHINKIWQQQSQIIHPQAQMTPCPNCNKPNPAGTKFCGDCGDKMEVAMMPCVKCSAPLREGAKFCNECGAKVAE